MGGALLKLRTWWETADRTQRTVTLFGSAFLVFLLFGTYYFASKPKMVQFLPGLTSAQSGDVAAELKKLGVPIEYDGQGNLMIPSDKVHEVTGQLAAAHKLPAGGHLTQDELNKLGMMDTPSVEREKLKAILEGSLATSIETIQGVNSASVHISLGERSAFAEEGRPPTASITIGEAPGTFLGSETAKSIAQLVANAVPGLTLKNVFVLNSTGRAVFSGDEANGAAGRAAEKLQAEQAEAARRERELQATFDRSFGPGATIVKVDLELDFDDSKISSVKPEVSENPVSIGLAKESYGGGRQVPAGAVANGGPVDNGGSGGKENYVGDKGTKEFGLGQTTTETLKGLGQLKRMSIAVLANSAKSIDASAIEKYLKGYLGGRATDPAFIVDVTSVKFDDSQEKAAKESAAAAASSARMQQIFSLLPLGALLIVAFLVIKSIGKAAKQSQNVLVGALPGGSLSPLGLSVVTGGAGGYDEEDGSEVTHDEHGAPTLAPRKKKKKAHVDDEEEEDEEVGKIRQRLNLPLEQIKRLSREKPETVAMLIKSWLLEEKR
ncbi:MAG: flagellar M-ring protein FliF C-terminal domain-containing protein [Fimbriimonadales bacterium]